MSLSDSHIKIKNIPPITSYGGRKGNMMRNICGLIKQYSVPYKDTTFVDIFGGSGIVTLETKLNLGFKDFVLNDFDRRIYAVHKCGELQLFKSDVAGLFDKKITKEFYGAVNKDYLSQITNMLRYKNPRLPNVATVSILRSIFNFRGKWKTNDNPIEGLYGQRPPIQPNIWKIPKLLGEMNSGITDNLYKNVRATNSDYVALCEKSEGLIYLDPPYIENSTVYRKGSGIIAIDSLELMAELDKPFVYSHDDVKVITKLADKLGLITERFSNKSRSGEIKTELLIHNLDKYYNKAKPTLEQWVK